MANGWGLPAGARWWHYFHDRKALCGQHTMNGTFSVEEGGDDAPENCPRCQAVLADRNRVKEALHR